MYSNLIKEEKANANAIRIQISGLEIHIHQTWLSALQPPPPAAGLNAALSHYEEMSRKCV